VLYGDDVDVGLPAAYDGVTERRLSGVGNDDHAAGPRLISPRTLLRLVAPRPRL